MSTTIDALREARSLLQREHPEHPVTVRLANAVDCVETLVFQARAALRIHVPLHDEQAHRIQCELREALRPFGGAPVSALIVPLHLMRNAVAQSQRLGMPETKAAVIDRVLDDLRTTEHPAVAAVLAQAEFTQCPPRSSR